MHPGHSQILRKRAGWTNSLRTGVETLETPDPNPAVPVTTDLPAATSVHFESTSHDTLSCAQNSFSTEANKPDSKLTATHDSAKSTQNSPSTPEAKQENGFRLCTTCGLAEKEISSQKIYEERNNYFGNNDERIDLEFFTQHVNVTAETGFISNCSLNPDETVVSNTVLSNTSTEGNHYTVSVSTQNTSTDMEADELANNCSLNSSSTFGPGAENDSVLGEGNDTHAGYDRPILDTTTTTTTLPTGCSDSCNAQDQYGLSWTGCPGSCVRRPCPNNALGEAKWVCDLYGASFVGDMPDYTNCTHVWIGQVQEEVSSSCDLGTSIGSEPPSIFVRQ